MKLQFVLLNVILMVSSSVFAQNKLSKPDHKPAVEFGYVPQISSLSQVDAQLHPSQHKLSTFGSAPVLTSMWVYAVGSSNVGWEIMQTRGQFATSQNHGGAAMRVAVMEIGYGSNPIGALEGNPLDPSKNYKTDSVCISGNNYVWPCPSGSIIVGYFRYYNIDGTQAARFNYKNTSTNFPKNTMSASILIL